MIVSDMTCIIYDTSPNVGFMGQSSAIFRLHLNIVLYIDKKKNVGIYTVSIGKMVREIVGNTFSVHIILKMHDFHTDGI